MSIIALVPLLSMLAFEAVSPNFSLHNYEQYFGVTGWGNNFYQCEVWFAIVRSPLEFLMALLRGGPFYVLCSLFNLFHRTDILPASVGMYYQTFNWDIFVKSALIWLTPLCLWGMTLCTQHSGQKPKQYRQL